MNYFYATVGVVSGVLLPLFLLWICGALYHAIKSTRETSRAKEYRDMLLNSYWYLVEINNCPNPDYLKVTIRNDETDDTITFGVNRKELKMTQAPQRVRDEALEDVIALVDTLAHKGKSIWDVENEIRALKGRKE